ncbi:universal stress protein [Candidatus Nitronereus thalassa]|uniref:Universal stress protein n=1 Tax=Candidatus Nitronereus thalassa TaxID=3020898 RepID=A0ABU3K5X8_9BACT|nr:universal stress protein [Candidatus Nitronereus thalassa]MDT7041767.1 universal stress protein [Candidatus Nitronereus thalassa]
MKILLSVDPTKNSQAIARCWGQFPIPSGTDLYLLQVIEVGRDQIAIDHSRVWERTLTIARTAWLKEAKAFLEKIRKYFSRTPDNKLNSFTAEGIPGEEILRIISTHRIDLVALGNRGLSGIKRFLLGSTSDRVLREAPCSVVIFRNKSRYAKKSNLTKNFKILLASEGPTDGLPSFEMLQSLNFFGSTSISILQVVEPPSFLPNWFFTKKNPKLIKMSEELMKRAQRTGQKHVREITKKFEAHGIKTKNSFSTGNPADEILKAEKRLKPDLIVMGANGWTDGTPIPLGGVARKVARYATCSVLVVRSKK